MKRYRFCFILSLFFCTNQKLPFILRKTLIDFADDLVLKFFCTVSLLLATLATWQSHCSGNTAIVAHIVWNRMLMIWKVCRNFSACIWMALNWCHFSKVRLEFAFLHKMESCKYTHTRTQVCYFCTRSVINFGWSNRLCVIWHLIPMCIVNILRQMQMHLTHGWNICLVYTELITRQREFSHRQLSYVARRRSTYERMCESPYQYHWYGLRSWLLVSFRFNQLRIRNCKIIFESTM